MRNNFTRSQKCKLLCSNCHKEEHYPDMTKEYVKSLQTTKTPKSSKKLKQDKFSNYPSFEEITNKYNELHS